ncbi:hypothetical protein [Xanthomonas translucens]|uniref:hypothetical protein n=1 Tax=Xanthomonas campestris pv. translucens TaxID=343 RepID=UPI0012D92477|nr:hypothetical protein [Xanthomonas translucens]UJB15425.1 hypothetical protein LTC53_01560 [Xanthomonas translucens pv. undulosa]
MIALKVLLAIISSACLLAVVHYVLSAAIWPKKFIARSHAVRPSLKYWAYYLLTLSGGAVILYGGCRTLLYWLPDSIGTHNEDGYFSPLKDSISIGFAFLVFPFLSFLDSAAINKVNADEKARSKGAEP